MSDFKSAVTVKAVPDLLKAIAFEPPAWTRLEPQSVTGDPTPGLEARVHDPLWLLARQWQFGEFRGEDAGTPLAVQVSTASQRVTAWQPGDPAGDAAARPLPEHEPLDPSVEREPAVASGPGFRQRAEAGALLVTALAEAGFETRAALVAACPLPLPPAGNPDDEKIPRFLRTVALTSPDGTTAAAALEAGDPAWLGGAPEAALEAAQEWLGWYRRNVAPQAAADADSWIPERLEYRFSLRVGDAGAQRVFQAPLHEGGALDWYSFDYAPRRTLALPEEPPASASTRDFTVMASPLRYAGMPADRLWQFEDGAVNLGKLEVQRHDLARLCFVEFAMIYGNDWFVVPVDAETGSFTTVTELAYTTTFGDRFVVPPADDRGRTGRFRLFEIGTKGTEETLRGLFIPPTARGTLEGRALEDVMFLRDETANMAWAVEATVQSASGDPRSRREETPPAMERPEITPPAELQYLLATTVPKHWIPLVPMPTTGHGGFALRKGTMTGEDDWRGELLHPTPLTIREEEIPREGVRVRRVPALVRAADGQCVRWITRRVSVGRGEGSAGLAFDGATLRR